MCVHSLRMAMFCIIIQLAHGQVWDDNVRTFSQTLQFHNTGGVLQCPYLMVSGLYNPDLCELNNGIETCVSMPRVSWCSTRGQCAGKDIPSVVTRYDIFTQGAYWCYYICYTLYTPGPNYQSTWRKCESCNAGSYWTHQDFPFDGRCAFCAAGKFTSTHSKARSPSEACDLCPAGTYSFQGATECKACATGRWSVAGSPVCNLLLPLCPAGTYSETGSGYDPCLRCPENTDTGTTTGSTAIQDCKPCATLDLYKPGMMIQRIHEPGFIVPDTPYLAPGTPVQACPNQNTCEACPANSRRLTPSILWNADPAANTPSPQSGIDSVSCQCDPGYAADCDWSPSESLDCFKCTCKACPAGKFKSWSGNTDCTSCGDNQEAEFATGSMACVQCGIGAYSETGQNCTCREGYSSNTESCSDWGWTDSAGNSCADYNGNPHWCAEASDWGSIDSSGGYTFATQKCCACDGETGRLPNCEPDFVCRTCAPNNYVFAGGCVPCPANSHNGRFWDADAASFSINDCICNQGFTRQIDGGSNDMTGCQACEAGKYMPDDVQACKDCPSGKNTVVTGATQCLCDQGYEYNNGVCVQCGSGTFKDIVGDGPCSSCGDHTTGPPGEVLSTCPNHVCDVGAEIPEGKLSCTLCPSNTYKTTIGSFPCDTCPTGSSTGALTGATSISSCTCNAGYVGSNGACTECDAGTYKFTQGASNCVDCPPNSYTELSASTSIASCVCNAGYEGAPGLLPQPQECSQCKAGKYKPDIGGQPCQLCPDHSNTPSTGSTSSTDCACNAGYTEPVTYPPTNGACTACVEGTFKTATGSEECTECTPHSSSPAGSISWSDCTCLSGYDGNHAHGCTRDCNLGRESIEQGGIGTCQLCPNGKYSDSTGPEACTACSENSHMDEGVTGATSHAECKCDAGYWDSGASCTACEAGKFNSDADSSECYECHILNNGECIRATGIEQGVSATSCVGICQVPVGWQANQEGNGIEPCRVNHYNDDVTKLECTQCPSPSTYTDKGALTSLQQCTCQPGYYRPDAQSSCEAADIGFYAEGADAAETPCPDDATSLQVATTSVSGCVCNAGYTPQTTNTDQCTACPSGTVKHVVSDDPCIQCPANSQLPADSPHLSESCRCNAGYTGPSASCTVCEAGSYKTSYGSSECTACTDHASTAASASTAITACSCNSGYEPASEGGPTDSSGTCVSSCGPGTTKVDNAVPPCQDCDAGTYKPDVGAQACTPCPAPRNASRVGAEALGDCSCRAGELDVAEGGVRVVVGVGGFMNEQSQNEALYCMPDDAGQSLACPSIVLAGVGPQCWSRVEITTVQYFNLQIIIRRHNIDLVIFECVSLADCANQPTSVELHGLCGELARHQVDLQLFSGDISIRASWYTRRAVETADVLTPADGDWTSDAAVQQLALSAQLRPGDYIFKDTWLGSTPTHCVPCAPGMWCAADIAASIAA